MRSVGIKTLKNKLSEYVRRAAAGETVLVTRHDRVIAKLVPPSDRLSDGAEDHLSELVRRGLATPASEPFDGPPPRHPVTSFDELMRELDESREDR